MTGTILCVDDDRNLCQILSKALSEEGYRVLTAFDGEEAVGVVAEETPDLVLLDLILPRRDGFAVIEAIRGLEGPAASTPVAIISGCSPTPEYRERAASLDVSAFLTKPVPLAQFLDLARCAVAETKREVPLAEEKPKQARRNENAPLQGALKRVPFPSLLHHLHGLRATGVLHLECGKKRKWIEFREGRPVAVRSNLLNECLGHYLLRSGRIKQADLAESRRRMGGARLQGEILVAMEVLAEEEITAALRAQADEKLFEVFSWEDGTFRFENGGDLQRANVIGVQRSPANLILSGVRTHFPPARIEAFFRSHADCVVVLGSSPFYRFQEVDLAPDQEALLRDLDGSRRVSEILSEDPDLSLARTLYALVATGLLELRSIRPASGGSPAAPRRPAPAPLPQQRAEPSARPPPAEASEVSALADMAQRFSAQDHFEILGVESSASSAEIERAYLALAKSAHPDRYSAASEAVRKVAEDVFSQITRAYETLIDPRSRMQYMLDRRRDEREATKLEEGRKALEAAREFQRGEALLQERNYEEALQCFGRGIELCPEEGDYHTYYGWTLHLCHPGEPAIVAEAIEHVRRGLKLASRADKAYLFTGRLYKAVGRIDAAEKMFARAVQIRPDCVEALRELRLIDMRRERSKGFIKRLLRR